MTPHWHALNTWHTELGIVGEAIEHLMREVEDPPGLSSIAYVLAKRLQELVESCPFPESQTFNSQPEDLTSDAGHAT